MPSATLNYETKDSGGKWLSSLFLVISSWATLCLTQYPTCDSHSYLNLIWCDAGCSSTSTYGGLRSPLRDASDGGGDDPRPDCRGCGHCGGGGGGREAAAVEAAGGGGSAVAVPCKLFEFSQERHFRRTILLGHFDLITYPVRPMEKEGAGVSRTPKQQLLWTKAPSMATTRTGKGATAQSSAA